MKRVEQIGVILSVFLILSFANKESASSIGLTPGSQFPPIQLTDTTYGSFRLMAEMHDFTLVHSWATYDAPSREKNIRFEQVLREFPQLNTSMIALSYDENPVLFEETQRMDRLTPKWQYFDAAGSDSPLYRKLKLKRAFSSYLIDRNGVIVAKDFTPEQLRSLLSPV